MTESRSPGGETVGAGPVKMDLESIDRSAVQFRLSTVDPVLGVAQVDVEDSPAAAADEMVVFVDGRIILSRPSCPLQRGNQSGLDQFLEIPMDGCRSDRRKHLIDETVKNVRRRMSGRLAQGAQELHSLGGQAYSGCLRLLQEFVKGRGHVHDSILGTRASCVKYVYHLIMSII